MKNWQFEEETIKKIIDDLSTDPDILSIKNTLETATVLIYYNHQAILQDGTQKAGFYFIRNILNNGNHR